MAVISGQEQFEILEKREDGTFLERVLIPRGAIIMWSGTISRIPRGWALCNGANGTPNLKDRFIMGATTDATINKTGGENQVTLAINQIPAHTHSGSTSSGGAHTHLVPHAYSGQGSVSSIDAPRHLRSGDGTNTSSAGSHTHTISLNNTGGGQAHENRPAYYTLAYIMKL